MNKLQCGFCKKDIHRGATMYVCDKCNFTVCVHCLGKHKGKIGGGVPLGHKCSQCVAGHMKQNRNS